MKAGFLRLTIMLLTGAAFFMLTACGTTAPTRFYLMNPMADAGHVSPADGNNGVSLALAPVALPEYLNRSQIVTRQNGHQVRVDEFNRWAEPLKVQVTEILAENLSMLLGTEGVAITNRLKQTDFDFHLSVKILRFDGWPGKEARLVCRWHLGRADEPAGAHPERFSATRSVEGDDYPDLVAALSSMLAHLSREIADRILSY
jgi:uncharacterized lipoprotein YmbA